MASGCPAGLSLPQTSPGSAIQLSGKPGDACILHLARQLVWGTGELRGSAWCSVLARSKDTRCRLKDCAETELINGAGHEMGLCRWILL